MEDLSKLKVKELQDIIVKLGMPKKDAEGMRNKAPLISTINTLRAKDATVEKVDAANVKKVDEEPVKKVDTLDEAKNPVEERNVNKRWFGKAQIMRAKLLKQLEEDPVSIIIPLEPNQTRGVVEWRIDKNGDKYQEHISGDIATPQENGFIFMIPKGIYYKVPRQIAESISKSEQQTLEAGDHISMNRIDDKTGRPIADII